MGKLTTTIILHFNFKLLKENLCFSEKCQSNTPEQHSNISEQWLNYSYKCIWAEECQILINSTTQQLKAFRETMLC